MAQEENPSAFKHWIGEALLRKIATSLAKADARFDRRQFLEIAAQLQPLELKPRVHLIRDQLYRQLPGDYPKALKILSKSWADGTLSGFDLWAYTSFIETYGHDHLDLSLNALKQLTQLFTGEFAVRPYLRLHTKEAVQFLKACSKDSNTHVRRWSSEGSRPRLPWGEKLHVFIQNPQACLPILENLKYDEELYVRKSVSNHLNDIAKDHPELVVQILKRWQKEAPAKHLEKIDWTIRRSLRSLIKSGHPGALSLLGVASKTELQIAELRLKPRKLRMNERLEFDVMLKSTSKKSQNLVVDYVIHFVKANGKTAPKVFKWKTFEIGPGESIQLQKRHHIKPITTRVYHPGQHWLEIQVNGKAFQKTKWTLAL